MASKVGKKVAPKAKANAIDTIQTVTLFPRSRTEAAAGIELYSFSSSQGQPNGVNEAKATLKKQKKKESQKPVNPFQKKLSYKLDSKA